MAAIFSLYIIMCVSFCSALFVVVVVLYFNNKIKK